MSPPSLRYGVPGFWFALLLLTGTGDGAFGADEPKPRLVIKHPDFVAAVAVAPDSKSVASACEKTVTIWDVASGKPLTTIELPKKKCCGLAFSPDGKRLVCGSADDGTVRFFEVESSKELLSIQTEHGRLDCLATSPDGSLLATGGDNLVKLWEVKTGRQLTTLKGHGNLVWSVAFSPDGKQLASGSWDNTARLWDVATSKELLKIAGKQRVRGVAFAPDGKTLLTGAEDKNYNDAGEVKLWDAGTGKEIREFKGLRWGAHVVAFSPDGKTVAAGTDDVIKLWDTGQGTLRATLRNSNTKVNVVHCLVFSADGKLLISGDTNRGDPNTVKIWEVTGQ